MGFDEQLLGGIIECHAITSPCILAAEPCADPTGSFSDGRSVPPVRRTEPGRARIRFLLHARLILLARGIGSNRRVPAELGVRRGTAILVKLRLAQDLVDPGIDRQLGLGGQHVGYLRVRLGAARHEERATVGRGGLGGLGSLGLACLRRRIRGGSCTYLEIIFG